MSRTQTPESLSSRSLLSRRDLMRTVGAGLLMLVALPDAEAQESGSGGRRPRPGGAPQEIGAWLHIAANGEVDFRRIYVQVVNKR